MAFPVLNKAYNSVFQPGRLSLGVVAPLEANRHSPVPDLTRHMDQISLAEQVGFAAVWLRDIPFNVPSFGDAGQVFDPLVYLGYLAARTERIGLGVASLILPLRHPAHVAKAAASVDQLSGGRLLLGIASGDRPEEYPALNQNYHDRGDRFRDAYDYIRAVAEPAAEFDNPYGAPGAGMDMLPKPVAGRVPMLVTGASQQGPDWLASHGDGWITYPRNAALQARIIDAWRERAAAAGQPDKPVMQSLYVDLSEDENEPPTPIHLGFRSGARPLVAYLEAVRDSGVNHVALNLRLSTGTIDTTLTRLAETVLPTFHA